MADILSANIGLMILGNRCYAWIFVQMYNQATLIYFVYKKFYYTLSIDIKFWFFVIKMTKLWHFKYLLSFQAKIVFLSFRIIDHVTDDFHPYIWKMFMTSWIVLLMSHFYPRHLYGLDGDEHGGDGDDYSSDQSLNDDCADQVTKCNKSFA